MTGLRGNGKPPQCVARSHSHTQAQDTRLTLKTDFSPLEKGHLGCVTIVEHEFSWVILCVFHYYVVVNICWYISPRRATSSAQLQVLSSIISIIYSTK